MELNPNIWIPVNGQVILKDDQKADKIGQIFLPDGTDSERLVTGTILAISKFLLENGEEMLPPSIARGRHVVYGQHTAAGNIVKYKGDIFRLAKWNEILAMVID